jgi:hypothetical protein
MEESAKEKFGPAQAAYEGLEIVLDPGRKITGRLQPARINTAEVKYANHD